MHMHAYACIICMHACMVCRHDMHACIVYMHAQYACMHSPGGLRPQTPRLGCPSSPEWMSPPASLPWKSEAGGPGGSTTQDYSDIRGGGSGGRSPPGLCMHVYCAYMLCMHIMHACMHAKYACSHSCYACILCMHAYHACISCMHACMHACIHACMHACMHPSIQPSIHPIHPCGRA